MKIQKYFSIILIALGSFLEIWYYIWRFDRDGIQLWLAAIIGITLTLLLSIAVLLKKKTIKAWFLIIPLAIYSVLATSAGQSFSLSELEKSETVDISKQKNTMELVNENKELKTQYQNERERVTKKIDAIGLWSRQNLYAEELENLERRRDFLDREILRLADIIYNDQKSIEINQDTAYVQSENIYIFYSSLINGTISPDLVQFFFQTILSIFIAIMAPVGITLIQTTDKKEEKIQTEKVKIHIDKNLISRWVKVNWTGVRVGKSQNLLSEDVYFNFLHNRNEEFKKSDYDIILKAAIDSKIIKKSIDTYVIIEHNESICTDTIFKEIESM